MNTSDLYKNYPAIKVNNLSYEDVWEEIGYFREVAYENALYHYKRAVNILNIIISNSVGKIKNSDLKEFMNNANSEKEHLDWLYKHWLKRKIA